MKKLANYCPLILLFLFATPKVNAQSVDVVIRDNGKERQESIELPKSMTYPPQRLESQELYRLRKRLQYSGDQPAVQRLRIHRPPITHADRYGNAIQRNCT